MKNLILTSILLLSTNYSFGFETDCDFDSENEAMLDTVISKANTLEESAKEFNKRAREIKIVSSEDKICQNLTSYEEERVKNRDAFTDFLNSLEDMDDTAYKAITKYRRELKIAGVQEDNESYVMKKLIKKCQNEPVTEITIDRKELRQVREHIEISRKANKALFTSSSSLLARVVSSEKQKIKKQRRICGGDFGGDFAWSNSYSKTTPMYGQTSMMCTQNFSNIFGGGGVCQPQQNMNPINPYMIGMQYNPMLGMMNPYMNQMPRFYQAPQMFQVPHVMPSIQYGFRGYGQ